MFIEHASDVRLEGVSVSFVGEAKPGNTYGECVTVDGNSTSGVVQTGGRCGHGPDGTAGELSAGDGQREPLA